MIKNAIKTLLYLIYPKRCNLCGEVIRIEETRCSECASAQRISGEICEKCGREKETCTCKKDKFSPKYKAFCAPYYYSGSIQRAVRRFKNYSFTELAPEMSREIAECVKSRFDGIEFDCVSSVPLTKKKLRSRGYNQSEILAKETASLLGVEYAPLLIKTLDTQPQRYSSGSVRRSNLYGAFELAENVNPEGKTVLLIDDVKTTGSTLNECAAVLRGYKANAVYCAAFTVTENKRQKMIDEKN